MPAGPGRGHFKSPQDRVRRNKEGYDENGFVVPKERNSTVLELPEWDGEIRGYELPEHPEGTVWHPQTVEWWDTWRRSPQAMYCIDTDWQSLFMGAIVHNRIMYGVSNTALAALTGELRKREGMFGAALEDRLRLNMGETTIQKQADVQIEVGVQKTVSYFEMMQERYGQAQENRNATGGTTEV